LLPSTFSSKKITQGKEFFCPLPHTMTATCALSAANLDHCMTEYKLDPTTSFSFSLSLSLSFFLSLSPLTAAVSFFLARALRVEQG
jgi:hypothetical protein